MHYLLKEQQMFDSLYSEPKNCETLSTFMIRARCAAGAWCNLDVGCGRWAKRAPPSNLSLMDVSSPSTPAGSSWSLSQASVPGVTAQIPGRPRLPANRSVMFFNLPAVLFIYLRADRLPGGPRGSTATRSLQAPVMAGVGRRRSGRWMCACRRLSSETEPTRCGGFCREEVRRPAADLMWSGPVWWTLDGVTKPSRCYRLYPPSRRASGFIVSSPGLSLSVSDEPSRGFST